MFPYLSNARNRAVTRACIREWVHIHVQPDYNFFWNQLFLRFILKEIIWENTSSYMNMHPPGRKHVAETRLIMFPKNFKNILVGRNYMFQFAFYFTGETSFSWLDIV